MKFTKMNGCGNDYIYINGFEYEIQNPEKLAVEMSERHFGVGSDGIVLILPSKECDFRMRMFNNDGSESEMCGNATRCIAKYVYDKGLTDKKIVSLETLGGIKILNLHTDKNNKVETVTVDMGEPILEPKNIPVLINDYGIAKNIKVQSNDKEFLFTCVSMGNPHAVTVINDVKNFDVKKYGNEIEINSLFPRKTNVEFVEIIDENNVFMRVWERGTGETLACGTGACATVVALNILGLCKREANVNLLGGTLNIKWDEKDNHIYMTGPAEISFEGEWLK